MPAKLTPAEAAELQREAQKLLDLGYRPGYEVGRLLPLRGDTPSTITSDEIWQAMKATLAGE